MEEIISEEQLEKLRHQAKARMRIIFVLSIVSFPIYLYLSYHYFIEKTNSFWFILAEAAIGSAIASICTMGLLWYIIVKKAYTKFEEQYKNKYVLQIIGDIKGFANLQYQQKQGFSWDEIRNAGVVGCGEKSQFECEDLLQGTYQDMPFRLSDVTTKRIVRRQKKTRVEEIFSGQVLCLKQFDHRKTSNGHLQIFEKEFLSNFSGWKAEHRIQTENEQFNSKFDVFATDEHNAYYILTPQRMERILAFAEEVGGQISLVFYEDLLFAAVKRDSMFDPVVDEPVAEQKKRIADDVKMLQKAEEILVVKE